MAKRKTPKVKNLGPKTITSEQLLKLQSSVKAIDKAYKEIGLVEAQKQEMLHFIAEMNSVVKGLENDFVEQYGTSNVSIVDGVIREENVKVNS
tara:strand:+ start:337 stop:615 length:279 start_codon:yes stop_codon:yes gene_type:complete